MAQLKFGSAGVSARETDRTGPVSAKPVGVPAGVIGTSLRGPAFVPVTLGNRDDFFARFGPTDGQKFGPLAVSEWLRNARAVTYLRVLGVGDGTQRNVQTGDIATAGFTVGEQEPDPANAYSLSNSPYANVGGALGRTYFLGCFMANTSGSTFLTDAGTQLGNNAVPIVRGIIMASSGVILSLSSSAPGTVSSKPTSTAVSTNTNGSCLGDVVLLQNGVAKQDFVLLLNGLKGTDPLNPNIITASFDMTSPNYFGNVLNTDPFKVQQSGHYLYAGWDLHPASTTVTGSGVVTSSLDSRNGGREQIAFLLTSSLARDVGSATVPDYEDFRDRFSHAVSPWVISQPFGGRAQNLFRVHALDDGAGPASIYKLSVENIALSTDSSNQYPTFDLVVRAWNDVDAAPSYLEQWRGLSLNPSDDRYIAKVIGDTHAFFDFDRAPTAQKLVVEGNYDNASNYIRIEVDPGVDTAAIDPTALPVGVRGIAHLVTAGTGTLAVPSNPSGVWNNGVTGSLFTVAPLALFAATVQPPLPMRTNITQGTGAKLQVNPLLYWGTRFEHVTSLATPNLSTQPNASMLAFSRHLPNHRNDVIDVSAGPELIGAADTAANGILDPDRFNNNSFTLMNVQVVTSSVGTADPQQWASAVYVRGGNIVTNDAAKTRRLAPADFTQPNRRFLKWTFMLQGGFDGTNVFDPDEAKLNSAAVEADMAATNRGFNLGPNVSAYTKAVQIMGETSAVDLQLLAVPGIRHSVVTDATVAAVTDRFDALYIMDIEQVDNDGNVVVSDAQTPSVSLTAQNFAARALDSSFAAAYFPDVVMPDPTTKTNVVVPPSVVVLGAMALNDAVGHPWFAPAGFTRGALQTTQEARVLLSKPNMDALYDANINPITSFPGNARGGTNPTGGVVVWGQRTLQQHASALDRVNVRRLLIEIRRNVRDVADTIIFEPNRDATLAKFSAGVTPRLARIQALAGLERFKIIIDSSTTTQQDIENNTIRGKIKVQPTKSLEYVDLDFQVTNRIQ